MPFLTRSRRSNEAGFDPTFRYETSWLLAPAVLFACRAFLSLYAFVTIFTIFGWYGTHGMSQESEHSFSYFTNLTYWGLAFYFAFSALHTCSYWLTGDTLLTRWPKVLQVAHSIFYSTVVVYPWLVTIVYWAILYSDRFPDSFSAWTNVSQHGLNSFYALFEIIFPRTAPLPFINLIPIVVILALYLGLAYLTYATQGFYVYSFLDDQKNSRGLVAGYIVGILVAGIVIFLIVRYLIVLRVWVTEKKLGRNGKLSSRGRGALVDEEAQKGMQLHNVPAK
ncbi:hypothetical protein EJ04DRAFT_504279 [Polyplosphaeria fusca]|uniref:Uncharacterized protein n=1 Tax=Polyplosphaeria fusca TaxID=682080 RepID=A0A9P4QNX2_9PLEO|nr:hypothetical protein EJ04DRAFT_504279 [Polyplosphaeria fusca]